MNQIDVKNLNGEPEGKVKLPPQFNEEVRRDIIKRAVLVLQSRKRQAYGAKPDAGLRASGRVSKRRRDYRGIYGSGMSRVPRKILSRRGRRLYWVGAIAPGTVGGRKAHAPTSEKNWEKKINKKENRKAIRSALSASLIPEIVKNHGYLIPDSYPFAVKDGVEGIAKTKEVINTLKKLGFSDDIEKASVRKIRAGKGKSRGRPYKKRKSVLIAVSKECPLQKAASNISGVDVVVVNGLNAELLAPGAEPGRAVLFTEASIKKMEKEGLFL